MAYNLVQWGKFLFHITHRENIPAMLARGLYSKNEAERQKLKYKSIADEGIQGRRHATPVPLGKGGSIHDYVPLFFGARPAMLCAVKNRFAQEDIYYVVVDWSVLNLPSTVFTDGNAATAGTQFYCEPSDLDKVDQSAVAERYWASPPDLRRRKGAEVLVWQQVPLNLIRSFIVMTDEERVRAEGMIAAQRHNLKVVVAKEYYYL